MGESPQPRERYEFVVGGPLAKGAAWLSEKLMTTIVTFLVILAIIWAIDGIYVSQTGSPGGNPEAEIESGSSTSMVYSDKSKFSENHILVFSNAGDATNTTEGISVISHNQGTDVFVSCEEDRQRVDMDGELEDTESICDTEEHKDTLNLVGFFTHNEADYYMITNNESYSIMIFSGLDFPLFQDNFVEDYYYFAIDKVLISIWTLMVGTCCWSLFGFILPKRFKQQQKVDLHHIGGDFGGTL